MTASSKRQQIDNRRYFFTNFYKYSHLLELAIASLGLGEKGEWQDGKKVRRKWYKGWKMFRIINTRSTPMRRHITPGACFFNFLS